MANIDVASLRASYTGPHELVRTSDGKTLFIRRWNPRSELKTSILIFHGITGYGGPYGPMMAEEFAEAGFGVFAMDLRGHGLSDGTRGDYPSRERLVEDLSETVALVKSKSRKLVLLGHSLGALAAVMAAKSRPQDVDGLIVLSAARKIRSGVYPRPKTGALVKTLIGVALLRGTPLIEYRRTGQIGLDDPLFDFNYSARFYTALYGVGALAVMGMFRSGVIDSPNLKFDSRLSIPLLVGVGDHDELFSAEAAKEFCDGVDCDDKEFFVIPGARHAVFPKGCWGPLVSWLGRKF
ncbi:MAG TPA: alpha/beta fold hydrolase [Nitrososphaerales archaeon]|nr:alpha/beta fold hydrolase [Nitrososphaerales archaeon]